MDALLNLFRSTLDADINVRRASELELRRIETQPGMLSLSLQLVASDQVDLPIRQAASIYMKNRISRAWDIPEGRTRDGATRVPEEDRSVVRNVLLPTIASVPENIRVHVASALYTVARCDYPTAWPTLLDDIVALLGSGQPQQVYAGARALLEVIRGFRFTDTDAKLDQVVSATFPRLLETATALVDTQEAGEIVYYALKVYKTSMVIMLSPHQRSSESIVPWGSLMLRVVQKELPGSDDPEEAERTPWWKAKKWAFFSLNKLFARYGSPSQLSPSMKSYRPFAEHFIAHFAPEILKAYLHTCERIVAGMWISRPVARSLLNFFTECVKAKAMWQMLRPHMQQIIEAVVYPRLCFSEEDAELWELDPIDFVRSFTDPLDEAASVSSAAALLLSTAVGRRTKTQFIPTLEFITKVLDAYPAQATPQQKDGALRMCVTISSTMLNHESVQDKLEAFFVQHVLPELQSPHAFLRLRACAMVQTFDHGGLKWSTDASLETAFRGVMECILDKELPVRVQAAEAIGELVAHDEVHASMAPNAGRLMQELLKLSDETDLDVLTATQEKIVNTFSDELLPFSVQLVQQMAQSYSRLVQSLSASEKTEDGVNVFSVEHNEEDKYFAALGSLSTMYQMVSAAESRPEILAELETVLLPVVALTLETETIDLYDDCFQLTDVLTYYQKKVSPGMWHIFELMYRSFKSSGVDYLSEMIGTFDNCVSYGTDVVRNSAEYRHMLLDIFSSAMTNDQLGTSDRIAACQLGEVILLLLKGAVDDAIPGIISTVLPHTANGKLPNLRKWSVTVVLDAIFYNATLALQVLEAQGATSAFFTTAIQLLPKFKRPHDCKVSIVAFLSILSLPAESLPETVRAGLPHIMRSLIAQLKSLPTAVAKRKALQRVFDEAFEDRNGFEEGVAEEFDDDADVQDDDNEYLELLAQEAARLRSRVAQIDGDGDGEADGDFDDVDDDDDDDFDDDDLVYESPLEGVPVFEPFRVVVQKLQAEQPALFASLTESLSAEQQEQLKQVYDLQDTPENGVKA
ncbi:Nonsense-mediated mRNA decay protein 5 [Malassezia cuniculi]|uniref:Nonsense-mediated mRNA decay protein 5 n=1 Tax=Malassezia cuniculi TaxID=948313 RepID=A0AAF0J569_9BASI|nr:Nonsense-mediated mRNA decay protein 5 [Malassezia cuniculi]